MPIVKPKDLLVLFCTEECDDALNEAKQYINDNNYSSKNVRLLSVDTDGYKTIQVISKSPIGYPLWLVFKWAKER